MNSVLSKLFIGSKREAFENIMHAYHRKGYAIVHYLYFANITGKKLFDNYTVSFEKEQFKEALKDDYKILSKAVISTAYKQALLDGDLVLPDGIALQIFYRMAWKLKKLTTKRPRLENLNGTDFTIEFLDWLYASANPDSVQLVLYGTYPGILEKTKSFLTEKGYYIAYSQDGYTNFDWDQLDEIMKKNKRKHTILIIARTTPEYPIQEIWSWSNKEKIKQRKLIVFTQGGTFDFWAGIQKRAPRLWRTYKLEWLWRLITNPKRNYKKVLDSILIIKYIFSYLLLKNK
ncbi:WecB/TagA/CpsF family glycosyl transferase [candidate division SR1 bacterium RAAC1_SR1_1]|nr:WecB/TagA/CpsF family glycosyl transferase [candidate division SR1 bacterium RAAC1_SR1_1]